MAATKDGTWKRRATEGQAREYSGVVVVVVVGVGHSSQGRHEKH